MSVRDPPNCSRSGAFDVNGRSIDLTVHDDNTGWDLMGQPVTSAYWNRMTLILDATRAQEHTGCISFHKLKDFTERHKKWKTIEKTPAIIREGALRLPTSLDELDFISKTLTDAKALESTWTFQNVETDRLRFIHLGENPFVVESGKLGGSNYHTNWLCAHENQGGWGGWTRDHRLQVDYTLEPHGEVLSTPLVWVQIRDNLFASRQRSD